MLELISKAFAEYFAHWSIQLPSESIVSCSRGEIQQTGWTIRYNPEISGDKERAEQEYYQHNRRVSETLKKKGVF